MCIKIAPVTQQEEIKSHICTFQLSPSPPPATPLLPVVVVGLGQMKKENQFQQLTVPRFKLTLASLRLVCKLPQGGDDLFVAESCTAPSI